MPDVGPAFGCFSGVAVSMLAMSRLSRVPSALSGASVRKDGCATMSEVVEKKSVFWASPVEVL